MRQTGTVKFFNQTKGFGFITPDQGGKDVFVHITAVERSNIGTLDEGMRVSFETEPDKRGKGPKAVNLQLQLAAGAVGRASRHRPATAAEKSFLPHQKVRAEESVQGQRSRAMLPRLAVFLFWRESRPWARLMRAIGAGACIRRCAVGGRRGRRGGLHQEGRTGNRRHEDSAKFQAWEAVLQATDLGFLGGLHDLGHEGRLGARLQGQQRHHALRRGRHARPAVHHAGDPVQVSAGSRLAGPVGA